MNEAKTLLAANDVHGAIAAAISHVKNKPTDTAARTFLFELLIFAGEFDRAEKQLDVLGQQNANSLIGTQVYRQCIAAEKMRQKTFRADHVPEFITAKPAYVQFLLDAIRALRNNNAGEAAQKLEESETARPAIGGKANDVEFQDFRDYNDLTASVLEVFLKGQYVWIPLEFVEKLEIQKPQSLRDVLWTQAKIELFDGTGGEIHLPAIYVDSFKHDDGEVKLGKATDWIELAPNVFAGAGNRLFAVNGAAKPLIELGVIEFQYSQAESEAVAA